MTGRDERLRVHVGGRVLAQPARVVGQFGVRVGERLALHRPAADRPDGDHQGLDGSAERADQAVAERGGHADGQLDDDQHHRDGVGRDDAGGRPDRPHQPGAEGPHREQDGERPGDADGQVAEEGADAESGAGRDRDRGAGAEAALEGRGAGDEGAHRGGGGERGPAQRERGEEHQPHRDRTAQRPLGVGQRPVQVQPGPRGVAKSGKPGHTGQLRPAVIAWPGQPGPRPTAGRRWAGRPRRPRSSPRRTPAARAPPRSPRAPPSSPPAGRS